MLPVFRPRIESSARALTSAHQCSAWAWAADGEMSVVTTSRPIRVARETMAIGGKGWGGALNYRAFRPRNNDRRNGRAPKLPETETAERRTCRNPRLRDYRLRNCQRPMPTNAEKGALSSARRRDRHRRGSCRFVANDVSWDRGSGVHRQSLGARACEGVGTAPGDRL